MGQAEDVRDVIDRHSDEQIAQELAEVLMRHTDTMGPLAKLGHLSQLLRVLRLTARIITNARDHTAWSLGVRGSHRKLAKLADVTPSTMQRWQESGAKLAPPTEEGIVPEEQTDVDEPPGIAADDENDPAFLKPAPGCGHPMPQGADCCVSTTTEPAVAVEIPRLEEACPGCSCCSRSVCTRRICTRGCPCKIGYAEDRPHYPEDYAEKSDPDELRDM